MGWGVCVESPQPFRKSISISAPSSLERGGRLTRHVLSARTLCCEWTGLPPSKPAGKHLQPIGCGLLEHSLSGELCDSLPIPLLMGLHFLHADPPLLHEPRHLLLWEPAPLLQLGLQRFHLDGPKGRGVHSCPAPTHFSPLSEAFSRKT